MRIVGVLAETPGDAFDEPPEQVIAELRPTPVLGPDQWRKQNHPPLCRALIALTQRMIKHNRAAGTLPAQVPGLRQCQGLGLDKQPLQHRLVLREIVNAGPRATRKPVPGQVAGNDHESSIQPPLNDVPIQAHVIVKTMDDEERRHRGGLWPPDLADQVVAAGTEAPQLSAHRHFPLREIQPVELLVRQPLPRQWLAVVQRLQAGAQGIGSKRGRHKSFQTGRMCAKQAL